MKVSSYGWYPPEPHQVVHNDILRRHVDIVLVPGAHSDVIFPQPMGFHRWLMFFFFFCWIKKKNSSPILKGWSYACTYVNTAP